jgi:hypothetical protein
MRRLLPLFLLVSAIPAFGQTQTVCRDPKDSGGYLYQGETMINGQACRQVTYTPAPQQQVVSVTAPAPAAPQPAPMPDPNATASNALPAAVPPTAPAPTAESASTEPPTALPPQPGARVAIAPMGGFETYFAAAIREKKVPITITLNKDTAQYFVVSSETEWHGFVYGSGGTASWNQNGGSAAHGAAASSTRGVEASIMVIDARTKDVVWAYEVHKNSHGSLLFGTLAARGQQSVAEACAKHLKDFIEKGK